MAEICNLELANIWREALDAKYQHARWFQISMPSRDPISRRNDMARQAYPIAGIEAVAADKVCTASTAVEIVVNDVHTDMNSDVVFGGGVYAKKSSSVPPFAYSRARKICHELVPVP